ncbi:MAG: DUF1893 domain-containing protein [Firmicutes bacterium]|nr:DUF1893 domain-containing protein [Bacillota bacterium]
MRDIDLARDRLLEGQYSLVIVKQGKLLFTSRDQGIKPIYSAVTQLGEILKGAVLADRVIGKAAAMLCSLAQVKSVYAELISSKAMEALNEAGIDLEYNKTCPYILNRSQDGMCPIEKLAASIDDGELLLKAIGQFLKDRE